MRKNLSVVESPGTVMECSGTNLPEVKKHLRPLEMADKEPSQLSEYKAGRSGTTKSSHVDQPQEIAPAQLNLGVITTLLTHSIETHRFTYQQVFEARRTLEIQAAALAASRRTEEEAKGILVEANRLSTKCESIQELLEHELKMHALIGDAAHNPGFALMISALIGASREKFKCAQPDYSSVAGLGVAIECQMEVAHAILNSDPDQAGTAMKAYFEASRVIFAVDCI